MIKNLLYRFDLCETKFVLYIVYCNVWAKPIDIVHNFVALFWPFCAYIKIAKEMRKNSACFSGKNGSIVIE